MMTPTPVVRLGEIDAAIYLKIEYLHPSGSLKHRALPGFLAARKRSGKLRPGQRIAILSAGSAGVSVAWAAARLGHRAIVVLPRSAPLQLVRHVRWLGAVCHHVSDDEIPALMQKLASERDVYLVHQTNEAELIDYYRPVAAEILSQVDDVAAITVGIGSGLSITGIGREIHERRSSVKVVGVEPAEAAVASGRPWAPHSIIGLAPPVPQPLLDRRVLSEIVLVPSTAAWACARDVYRRAGLPVGPSSGATISAALELRRRGIAGPIVAVCACAIGEFLESAPDSVTEA